MQVFLYTNEIQKAIKSKIKAEPYLHILTNLAGEYAIYVWDTRKILESGEISYKTRFRGSYVNDNKQPLIGETKVNFQGNTGTLKLQVTWELNKDRNGKIGNVIARLSKPIECSIIDKYGSYYEGKLKYLTTERDYSGTNKQGFYVSGHFTSNDDKNYGYTMKSYRTLDGKTLAFNMPDTKLITEWLEQK